MIELSAELHKELMRGRVGEFIVYHRLMDEIGDVDPQYPMLRYICDRFELTLEQRYWLAFLVGATYSAPTVYYMYNEFPDYENVDIGRFKRWWFDRGGREKSVFQSDRAWIRSRSQIIPMLESYNLLLAGRSQAEAFQAIISDDPHTTYNNAYKYFIDVKYMGRFSMFLWLEAVYVVTGFPMHPTSMPWKESSSASSRNGMCYALGCDDLLRGHGFGKDPIIDSDFQYIEDGFQDILGILRELDPGARIDVWSVETSLCAYKKWRLGIHDPKRVTGAHYRYPGYYLDRQHDEIVKMRTNVREGVDWDVLWDFRSETLPHQNLLELGANNRSWAAVEMARRLLLLRDGVMA